MENEVKNDYIEKALNELIPVLGIKEFANQDRLTGLIEYKKVKEAIKEIALYLGLPIEVNISYVPKGYRPSSNDGFQSTHLVKTYQHNHGVGGITAQVSIPSNLPFYKTPSMVNFPIKIRLSEGCTENPETFISVMAHELSHIVLHSMWHKEKDNEFYTDLTAMIFGFAKIMRTGRKVVKTTQILNTIHTETTTYGYISDDNFDFAFKKIKTILNKQKSIKREFYNEIKQSKKRLSKFKKLLICFEKYLAYIDKNLQQKISQEDGYKIGAFHQPGYTENFLSLTRRNEINLENYINFIEKIETYNDGNMEAIKKYETQLKSINNEIEKQGSLFQKDIDILEKYIGFFYKLKIKFTKS